MSKDYTESLNLPQTSFSMRANLPQREPEMLKNWQKIDLYNLINKKNAGNQTFLLHDGPPFSNGNIHMGTAMNKVLKDIINRSKMMEGYRVPYIPGWDNHGPGGPGWDDHRGYYPRHSHYDWVTTLCKLPIDGKPQYFGFNLTRNQSIDQDRFNENLIWFENDSTLLTPVTFTHETPLLWHIQDEHGMVDVTFDIGDEFVMKFNLGLIQSDYHITFGTLSGFVCDPDGKKYALDGLPGIGEDKTLVF